MHQLVTGPVLPPEPVQIGLAAQGHGQPGLDPAEAYRLRYLANLSAAVPTGGGLRIPEGLAEGTEEVEPQRKLRKSLLSVVMVELDHIQRLRHVLVSHAVEGHHIRADGGLGKLTQDIRMAVDKVHVALIMEPVPLHPDVGILPGPGRDLDLVKIVVGLAEDS